MILADKIIDLRKKNGWSQEELAEKLDVSRQSVSKWESAQAVPDMNRILKLSDIFGVSTDYLLKDELDAPESTNNTGDEVPWRKVSMEEASSFMTFKQKAARRISTGVLMCILSPILLFVLPGLQGMGYISLSESQAGGIGLIVLFVLVGGAVALFVSTGLAGSRYEYMEKETLDTAYGVNGVVRERQEQYRGTYVAMLVTGIVLCVISVIPVAVSALFADEENPYIVISVAMLLALVAAGVFMIVRTSIVWGSYQMLLEEGDYSRERKTENRKNEAVTGIYWASVTAGYLAWSFITGAWHRTWIVWPLAGVAYGILSAVLKTVHSKQ